jgi:hypothetical protein
MKFFLALAATLALQTTAQALDREAFTATRYNLTLRLEPAQQRLTVRGKITLRNDSSQPQRIASLQISSSLNWRSIRCIPATTPETTQAIQFLTQPYTSDIDHTGELSEAIITLPQEVAPKESVNLAIGYEGVIVLDTTRLTRIGTPETVARHSDWDQIGKDYSAIRGIGYVTWYPVAMEVQNLLDGNAMFAALGKWKARHAASKMELEVELLTTDTPPPSLLLNAKDCVQSESAKLTNCKYEALGFANPTLVVGNEKKSAEGSIRLHYLPEHANIAQELTQAADRATLLVKDWFGTPRTKPDIIDLADPDAAPYEAASNEANDWLLLPLAKSRPQAEHTLEIHQLTHAAFPSPRLWLYEGSAHFAQAIALEKDGRPAAIDYLESHRQAVVKAEKDPNVPKENLIDATQEVFYRSKAALVWWMLRDMAGDAPFKRALHNYHPTEDTDPTYFEHLVEAESKRDLTWFFHDWVNTNNGLPDFRIEQANARQPNGGSYITAITVANEGNAGAEVTVTVRTTSGDFPQKLEVRAKTKSVTRIASPAQPIEVVVNDGSVPELNATTHTFKIGE